MKKLIVVSILLALSANPRAETVIAKSIDSYGTVTLLTDLDADEGVCKGKPMVVGYGPQDNMDQAVYGCWQPNPDHSVHVTYLLSEGVTWNEDYKREDFQLTPYGKSFLRRSTLKVGRPL